MAYEGKREAFFSLIQNLSDTYLRHGKDKYEKHYMHYFTEAVF